MPSNWNAKVGPDAHQHWAGTVGRFGTGETKDRRWRLLEFAKSHRLTRANTLHPHKLSRTATWHTPDINLTPKQFKSSINKSSKRPFPGADIGSDHDLEFTTIKLKLKTERLRRALAYDLTWGNSKNRK